KLNPKDRIALVTDDVTLLADFTSDKQQVKAQLDSLKKEALSGRVGMSYQYDALLSAVKELFDNNGTRPIVIFQTDGDQLDALRGAEELSLDPYSFPRKYSFEDVLTATEKTRATVYSVISGLKFLDVPEADLIGRAKQQSALRGPVIQELMRNMNWSPLRVSPRNIKTDTPPDKYYLR